MTTYNNWLYWSTGSTYIYHLLLLCLLHSSTTHSLVHSLSPLTYPPTILIISYSLHNLLSPFYTSILLFSYSSSLKPNILLPYVLPECRVSNYRCHIDLQSNSVQSSALASILAIIPYFLPHISLFVNCSECFYTLKYSSVLKSIAVLISCFLLPSLNFLLFPLLSRNSHHSLLFPS